ncbi:glyoxysomal processing protease, glyoxysomal isoform X2 [Cryptomeria japonica]|uniref:glyoxysomal processing protease, glyoxysomal isoform X2 n=1 Tax=Cryptomeria japonica TaxID=3369 RepID=UPI0027DA86FF|nr:glyoxysomal processing protease, glyoxysomal isoform X2 [Cryptomeria japonica]
MVEVPEAAAALQALLEAHGGTSEQSSWEVGWALAPADSGTQMSGDISQSRIERKQTSKDDKEIQHFSNVHLSARNGSSHSSSGIVAMATTIIAVLIVSSSANLKIMPEISISEPRKRGDFLLVIGSPFGALSPLHFYNSISMGIVANSWPPASSQTSLLMADIRCLPGMEGSPVFSDLGNLVGILTRPLRQRGGGAEVQLVVTWDALAPALGELQLMHPEKFRMPEKLQVVHQEKVRMLEKNMHLCPPVCEKENKQFQSVAWSSEQEGLQCFASNFPSASSEIDRAMASIVLVTVGDGAWASGIVLNDNGLVLTNAHLLEPWRFGKTPPLNKHEDVRQRTFDRYSEKSRSQPLTGECTAWGENQVNNLPYSAAPLNEHCDNVFSSDQLITHSTLDFSYRSYRRIRVRLDHMHPRSWYDARVVYVSKGPLDIALLQINLVPNHLCPIVPEEKCPYPGSKAFVIGHGLFGPRSDLCPSVSAGVVAKVVKTRKPAISEEFSEEYPAMLETTAAVHPGGSGGVVVNSQGRMIGLVTSNARHSGGTVIPHLNFSIPCAALKSVFTFAKGDTKDLSILYNIDKPNELLSAVWALVPPTPPRPSPSLPFLPDVLKDEKRSRDGVQKGSRFAKFVAEKGAELALKQDRHQKLDRRHSLEEIPIRTSRAGDFLQSRL